MNSNTKKITTIGMLSAIAYAVMLVGRVPVIMFLSYDPKDVIITIGGFLFGPFSAFTMSLVVSLVEMFTASDTGFIGLLMNVLASCAFACSASAVYKRFHTLKGALLGLAIGSVLMTVTMLLWNYIITPIYLGFPREDVAAMLLPVFLPFNALKAGINTALTLLLYKPLQKVLKRTNMLVQASEQTVKTGNLGVILLAATILITCTFFVLVLRGVL